MKNLYVVVECQRSPTLSPAKSDRRRAPAGIRKEITMGETKHRRRVELGKNMNIVRPTEAIERLDAAGEPMQVTLIGAGLVPAAITSGAIMAKEITAERHLLRFAFMVWDRIRTGEYDPWTCSLCGRDYSGLTKLSVFGIVEHALGNPTPSKPAAMALVCEVCDCISTEETKRRLERLFGVYPLQEGQA
jgi:hypothetical protein